MPRNKIYLFVVFNFFIRSVVGFLRFSIAVVTVTVPVFTLVCDKFIAEFDQSLEIQPLLFPIDRRLTSVFLQDLHI